MGWYEDSLFGPIAANIAATVPEGAAVLEAGCGSGSLSVRLAADHGLNVTAFDIDPEEVMRARARARGFADDGKPTPTFLVADVARMPFDDASFDLVVSTFSMHHWDDKVAGLVDVHRVLRPGSRALIWDLRRGFSLFHLRSPEPLGGIDQTPLEVQEVTPWPWPFGFTFFRRLVLARPHDEA